MENISQTLAAIDADDVQASERLLTVVYDELRRLAAQRLSRESADHTLNPTALVHEAYIRLVDQTNPPQWNGRGHFFGAAAEAMRRILIDRARHRRSLKAGGECRRRELTDAPSTGEEDPLDLLALDDALQKLEQRDARKAKLVKLRFFAGLTIEQAASALAISTSTADNDWAFARAWLKVEMDGTDGKE